MNLTTEIKRAAQAVAESDALLITAGAGMGVDSGLPDFRGTEGFWKAYPLIAKLGLRFEEMADPDWFERDPALAWAFYGHRLNLYRRTAPHRGFGQLLDLARTKPHGCFVFTSNVDGHFQLSGFPSDRIIECHGSIHHFQCAAPCGESIWDATAEQVEVDELTFRARAPLPKCRHCAGLARPNILMFGDGSWLSERADAQYRRWENWLDTLAAQRAKLTVIELGAGSAIPTVRRTSEETAARFGGTLIRINPREPETPSGQVSLPLGAAEAVQRISVAVR
jgi:NAD-dependent SIR2 family protein deacetylase